MLSCLETSAAQVSAPVPLQKASPGAPAGLAQPRRQQHTDCSTLQHPAAPHSTLQHPTAPCSTPQRPYLAPVPDTTRCRRDTRCAERPLHLPGGTARKPLGTSSALSPHTDVHPSTIGSSRACPCSFCLICSPLRALPSVTIFPIRIRSRYWINHMWQPAGPER